MYLINSDLAAPLIDFLFTGDPDFEGDTYAIAIGAFWQLTLWSQRYGLVDL